LVRDAATRPLGSGLVPILERIEEKAKETEAEAGAGVVFKDTSPPEPTDGEITISPAGGIA
jgi:hypothetical protein